MDIPHRFCSPYWSVRRHKGCMCPSDAFVSQPLGAHLNRLQVVEQLLTASKLVSLPTVLILRVALQEALLEVPGALGMLPAAARDVPPLGVRPARVGWRTASLHHLGAC